MKKLQLASLTLAALLLAGCGASAASTAESTSEAVSTEETAPAATAAPAETPAPAAALPDGVYTAKFNTDSSMFHANEAVDGMGTLTVENGTMTFHVSLQSQKIVNLYPGMAADAPAHESDWLQPTVDTVTYSDGTSVCGMVTFRDGKPYKAGYRKFKMKTVAGTDDYASLAETVSRRAAEYEKYSEMAANGEPSSNYFGQKPDLLLMDGGRGQVSAAKAALAGTALADVPLYGMVKDDHHRTRAIVDSEGREIAINMNRGTFTFVTAIQDETHRFANAYRKQQMKQKSYSSTLTEVPGVGPKTAKALMAQFKSVGAVKEATPDQLENTHGVGRQMAQTIYEYFHPQG